MDAADRSGMLLFEGFGLDRNGGGLFRLDKARPPVPISIGWRALEVLSVLLENQGMIVSRKRIIDAVWPDAVVEEGNLTVQMSALRRALDRDDPDKSCIQTVPGRGYRFVGSVTQPDEDARGTIPGAGAPGEHSGPSPVSPDPGIASAPRLSVVVLPFGNLGGTRDEDYLADAITDDLTTDLSRLPGALVIAHRSAATYKGKPVNIRKVG
jgi:DNA-binding winged helix-turn-helix (wHTH) protein